MTDEMRKEVALLRYRVIAPLISGTRETDQSLKSFFLQASEIKYKDAEGKLVSFSAASIERWYYKYINDGFDALIPQKRNDKGNSRKLDDELKAQIKYYKNQFPRIPATLVYQKLLENGSITTSDVSLATVTRYIKKIKDEAGFSTRKHMRRYELENANDVWYADTSYCFSIDVDGKKKRTYIIAFLDDRSRLVTGIDIFFEDNFVNAMAVLKSAITKYGKPKLLSLDNGSPYKNKQMELLSARVGFTLNYNPPSSPESKAKIERFFKTLKMHWMSVHQAKDFRTLAEMKQSLREYALSYNNAPHSSLEKKSPHDVFFEYSDRLFRLSDTQLRTAFLLEYERKVSNDNIIKIDNMEYEVPYRYAKQRITLRYSADLAHVFVVDPLTGGLEKINLLRKNDNAHIKRAVFQFGGGES